MMTRKSHLCRYLCIAVIPGVTTILILYFNFDNFTSVKETYRRASVCNQLEIPEEDQIFQRVPGGHSLVFSAYSMEDFNDGHKEVVITGMTKHSGSPYNLTCIIRFRGSQQCQYIPARVEKHRNSFGRWLVSSTFSCPFASEHQPTGVALINTGENSALNRMEIINQKWINGPAPEYTFVVCFSPLHNDYNNVKQLMLAVEFNKILGAEFFVFYNRSISRVVDRLLRDFMSNGMAEVIQWDIPKFTDVHYSAQFLAMNDCVFRNSYRTKFVINTDLDEFIVPRDSPDWHALYRNVLVKHPNCGAFAVRTAHFYTVVANHTNTVSQNHLVKDRNVLPLLSTNRSQIVYPAPHLSKLIVRPQFVLHMGVHRVWGLKNGASNISLSPKVAMNQHYAHAPKFQLISQIRYTTDMYVYRYKKILLENLVKKLHSGGMIKVLTES